MCRVCQSFRTCWIPFIFVLILKLTVIVAVRFSDPESDPPELSDCPDTCTSPSHRSGSYELRGEAARGLKRADQYFVSSSCHEAPGAVASVVPWIDAEDPINGSFVAVFADPVLINKMRRATSDSLRLCAVQNGDATCICKLVGESPLGVLERAAALLPHSSKVQALQLAMESCPENVPDLLAGTLLVSCLLVIVVATWMLWAAWASSRLKPLTPKAHCQGFMELKTPMQNFLSGLSWAAGFMLSLAAMQTGALSVVQKSCDYEAVVWLVAASPTALALAATVRLMQLLAKKQLCHASLGLGCVVVDQPQDSSDFFLVAALLAYFLLIVCMASIDITTLLLVLTALSGSTWTVLKAVSSARDTEKSLKFVEVSCDHLAETSEKPKMAAVPWVALREAHAGKLEDLQALFSSSSGPSPSSREQPARFSLGFGLARQGAVVRLLTGSCAGFMILPSFVALLALSLCLSAAHMTRYACSVGELTDLNLVSSMHSLTYAPWQLRYEVTTDVAFQQLAMVAWVRPSATRLMSFGQPEPAEPRTILPIQENQSSAVEEIQLVGRQIPRVASVWVQGLRPSRPETQYQVRFSPADTIPTVLWLRAGSFTRAVAWSTLSGSVISIPAGEDTLQVEVGLADFTVSLPRAPSAQKANPKSNAELWTSYEPHLGATEALCSKLCADSLHCFRSYPGAAGCYPVLGDRESWEGSELGESQTEQKPPGYEKRLRGQLDGCRLDSGKPDEGTASTTRCGQVKTEGGRLNFGEIQPDWGNGAATLSFNLDVRIGGLHFDSHVTPISLQQGPPRVTDVLAVLLGVKENGTSVLRSQGTVDDQGGIVINVSRYDPSSFQSLRLLVMPVVSDPAFRANWSEWSPADVTDRKLFKENSRCAESVLVRSRYTICAAEGGVTHGRLQDKPLAVAMEPFTGQLIKAPPSFTVVPRKVGSAWEWSSENYGMALEFQGVDSPAAWAAQSHGCAVLNHSSEAELSILGSADAVCQLLSECGEQLCDDVIGFSLGRVSWSSSALVPSEGTVQLLTCLNASAPECSRAVHADWRYAEGRVRLLYYTFQVPMRTLLEQADRLRHTGGLALLQDIRRALRGGEFDKDAAQEVWRVKPSAELLVTLAGLDNELPKLLLEELMRSPFAEAPPATPELQAAFANLTQMTVSLHDAAQLHQVAALAEMATGLGQLHISCRLCKVLRKAPFPTDFQGLSRHTKLRALTLRSFQLARLPVKLFHGFGQLEKLDLSHNQLQSLPAEIFHGLEQLKEVSLNGNKLQSLPAEVFHGLKQLKEVSLNGNKLQSLPTEVFHGLEQLKELSLFGNKLQSLPAKVFHGLEQLEKLDLSNNQLQSLPAEVLHGLKQLQTFSLKGNQIQSLPAKVFHGLEQLETLALSRNHLQSLPAEAFHGLERLRLLLLSQNEFQSLQAEVFHGLPQLKELNLVGCEQLSRLPAICEEPSLRCTF
ncbi:LRRC15 [Symbiodinium sp. CCMP2592]|nr:LRRC15 [Symbiodinium sp. CCMP2592]